MFINVLWSLSLVDVKTEGQKRKILISSVTQATRKKISEFSQLLEDRKSETITLLSGHIKTAIKVHANSGLALSYFGQPGTGG